MEDLSALNIVVWLVTLFILSKVLFLRRKVHLPPGPKPWPIIGNFNLISALPHRSIHDLSQKYGPLMHIKLGSRSVVVASSMEFAKEFLQTHDAVLAGRPKMAAESCVEKKYTVKSKGGASFITPSEFKEILDELFLLNGVLNIGDYIPWLGFLDLQGYVKRMKATSKKFDRFLENVIDEHNEKRRGVKDWVAMDMVDVLLQTADSQNPEFKLDRTGVKAITLDLIAGGTQSSLLTVEWAIAELLKNPRVLEIATEELNRVIGRERWVEEKDIPQLPFIEAIIKETMRLHPTAPMLVPRLAREDCKIAGFDIPAGTLAYVSVWSIGRDPTLWEKPEEFYPERFIDKTLDVKGTDFQLLPFGAGRRMCPGYPLGLKVIQSNVANLLHGFSWNLPGEQKPEDLDMGEVFGLAIPKKHPLEAVIEPSLPSHLY